MQLNISKELHKLYAMKAQLNEIISTFQAIADEQEAELLASDSVSVEICTSEVDDIVSDGYKKAMLFQALEDEKTNKQLELNMVFEGE